MASTEEGASPPPPPQEKTLDPTPPTLLDNNGAPSSVASSSASPLQGEGEGEGDPEDSSTVKTLEFATELFNKGSKAVEDGDFVEAVDCLSRALEIRVEHYGELAPECATSYYKYGCALLYKSQEESEPLGNVPKNGPKYMEKDESPKDIGDEEGSKISATDTNASSNNEEVENGANAKDQGDDNEGCDGDGEELVEGDEDDSDLDLAWKMLDVARAIVERCPDDNIEKVNIFSALGEVSLEREDFETSLNDYLKALSILERMAEPDCRRMVELNFRICLVLEVWSKVGEAIPYCQKAISLCKSRLMQLREEVKPTTLLNKNVNVLNDSGLGGSKASGTGVFDPSIEGVFDPSIEEDEKAVMSGILSELERKLEDLQQVLSNPKSIFSEIMKMVSSRSTSADMSSSSIESAAVSLNSSQMGAVSGGFDSPTISIAATNGGGITHLGVVGRGVKRASLNPVDVEPSSKKLSLDSSSEGASSSVSKVNSAVQDAETPKE